MKKVIINEQVWTAQRIKEMMLKHDKALYTGLVKIYSQQNNEEQAFNATLCENGQGFNSCDANILSSMAKQIIKGYKLSPKQLDIARTKMPKYANQLLRMLRATA